VSDRNIELSTEIQASPDAVFHALVDADELVRWFPSRAESDARPGGAFEYAYEFEQDPSRNHTYSGEYRDVTPNERVSYPWNGKLGTTEVEFRLEAANGGTRLTLAHSGWGTGAEWDESLEMHRQGWGFFLGNLKAYLEGGADQRGGAMGMKTPASVAR
jgi:uncharacterized protein YndB with AHSA1/START domain